MGTDHRVQSLRERLQEEDLDAILISSAENRRYLSGFAGSAGFLLISRNESVLLTDFRYTEQAGNQAPDFRIERIKGGLDWFPEITSELKVGRLGFEGQDVTFSAHSAFNKALDEAENASSVEMVSTSGIVEEIRAFKDEDELNLLTRAIELSDQAIERITPTIEPGVTEGEVAWELEKAMRESGSENVAFDIIVGAGPNGALPHHRAGDKAIEKGEAIVIDMGARYEGYNSDLTRTVIVGEPDETFRKVYDTVLHAQLTAIEKVTNGMTGEEADAISPRHHRRGGLRRELRPQPRTRCRACRPRKSQVRTEIKRRSRKRHGIHHRTGHISVPDGAACASRTLWCWKMVAPA